MERSLTRNGGNQRAANLSGMCGSSRKKPTAEVEGHARSLSEPVNGAWSWYTQPPAPGSAGRPPKVRGFVDLHCHYIPAVDDGVRTEADGLALLAGLRAVGFDHVVATPHIRPSMFDNSPARLREAFAAFEPLTSGRVDLPKISLAAEHFFDDIVYGLLVRTEGLPYGKGRSALIEFSYENMPLGIEGRFFDLRVKRIRPVVAHPERYEQVVRDPRRVSEKLRRAGGVLLLDVAALVGKYGERAQRTAEVLLREEAYYAACSDAHRPEDANDVGRAIVRLESLVGPEETQRLLRDGPGEILEGRILDAFD